MGDKIEVMKGISEALDLSPLTVGDEILPVTAAKAPKIELTQQEKESEEDFKTSRETALTIIEQGTQALREALMVASASQNPRAFEVVSKLIKDLADANQSLLALHESRRALAPPPEEAPSQHANTINNNTIIVDSPQQLLDMVLNKLRNEDKGVIDAEFTNES